MVIRSTTSALGSLTFKLLGFSSGPVTRGGSIRRTSRTMRMARSRNAGSMYSIHVLRGSRTSLRRRLARASNIVGVIVVIGETKGPP